MRYLSIDLEATGLRENDLIIEIAFVPFDVKSKSIAHDLTFHTLVQCPSFQELKPKLDKWVIEHNEKLITDAHQKGMPLAQLRKKITEYLESPAIKNYFGTTEKITLFGKSMNAIDLPFLNRDLGFEFMRQYFHHRDLDLSSVSRTMIDLDLLPEGSASGSKLMSHLGMGDVAHNALDDAVNTAKMYFLLIDRYKKPKAL